MFSTAGFSSTLFYTAMESLAITVHFAFLVYLTVGGFLAWRWHRTIYAHLLVVGWGFSTLVFNQGCPLTDLENWARRGHGSPELPPSGFIAHYLTGVVYPAGDVDAVRAAVAGLVIASWVGYLALTLRRHHSASARHDAIPTHVRHE